MNPSAKWMKLASRMRLAGLVLALGFLVSTPLPAQVSREYDVKAAFLYNFITFTDWPADVFPTADSPYVIGVIGDDPFGSVLDAIVTGERIKGRPLVVRRFHRLEDMHRCQILFISSSEARKVKDILNTLREQPVLTVADLPGFAESGGGIGFVSNTRVKLIINPVALRAANLNVSSKLLRLAELVPERRVRP